MRLLIAGAAGLMWAGILGAQAPGPISNIYVASPKPRLISGETVKLTATARDSAGVLRPENTFTWSTTDASVAAVDSSGNVTARALGLAEIRGSIGNVRGAVTIQVLPARIVVTPGAVNLFAGDRQQFKAEVLDGAGKPMTVGVSWDIVNAMLRSTVVASVDRLGNVNTSGAGRFYVRARFNYSGQSVMPFAPYAEGVAEIDVKLRRSHDVRAVIATGPRPAPGVLRGRRTYLSSTAAGDLIFLGSLDGSASALMLQQGLPGGRLRQLASSGMPGPVPFGLVYEWQNFAANRKGQVLSRGLVAGAATGLMLAPAAESGWIASEGMYAGEIEVISSFAITRNSLNNTGEAVARATFRLPGDPVTHTGLFRFEPNGEVALVASTRDQFPELDGPLTFEGDFGIADSGTVLFRVSAGAKSVLFKQSGFSAPEKVVALGDPVGAGRLASFAGTTYLTFFVSGQGDVVFYGTFTGGVPSIVHIPPSGTPRLYAYRSLWGVFDVLDGQILWYGDAGRGAALYVWKPDGSQDRSIAHDAALGDERITQIDGATFVPGGVAALVRTARRPFVLVRSQGTAVEVITEAGAAVEGESSVSFQSLIKGTKGSEPPMLYGMGDPGSLLEFVDGTLRSRLTYGDRFDGDVFALGVFGYQTRRSANGALYHFLSPHGLSVNNHGLYRIDSNAAVAGTRFNYIWPDGTTQYNGGTIYFAAEDGRLVVASGTSRNHSRLAIFRGNEATLLATNGTNPDLLTRIAGSGDVTGWSDAVLAEDGRVMATLRFRNSPDGVFLWQAGQWTPLAIVNQTQFAGLTVTGVNAIRASGSRLYACFNLSGGGSLIAEWADGQWKTLVSHQDTSPTGQPMAGLGAFDVNRRGEVLFFANSFGWPTVLFRKTSGELSIVSYAWEAEAAPAQLVRYVDLELRDDGRAYLLALDVLDRYVLLDAMPR